ncbi:MAG: hypothetical protein ABIL01_03735 [Pseudomonadota bacterium]
MTARENPIDVWIVMDESGHYVVAEDEDTVYERASGELNEDQPQRYIRLKINLARPSDDGVSAQVFELTLD